jgi:hypothetical protein
MRIFNLSTDVIRNSSHFSHVQTGLLRENSKYKFVVKKAFTRQGEKEIEREMTGLNMFCNAMNVPSNEYIIDYQNNRNSAVLKIKYINGEIGDCHAGMKSNFKKLKSLVEFFKINKLYKKNNGSHGDLSVSNIIYNNTDVFWIIDWENYNKLLPPVHDLVYCITEIMLFEFIRKSKLDRFSIHSYRILLEMVLKIYSIEDDFLKKSPSNWLRNNIIRLIESGDSGMNKCPFVKNDILIINKLDKLIFSK